MLGSLLLLGACAGFKPGPLEDWPDPALVQTLTDDQVTVSAGILSDERAAQLYGADLAEVGLQAIWLRVDNRSEHGYWLLVSALDPHYFAPDEAAVLFHARLSRANEQRITQHFRDLAMPLKTAAGQASEGFVLAPRHEGGRYVTVALAGQQRALRFGFPLPLPDGEFDFEDIDPSHIYDEGDRPSLTLDQMRAALRRLPCCTADKAGRRQGDPLNLVLIGEADEILASLSRGGWSFTHRIDFSTVRRLIGATLSGTAYTVAPVSPLYAYDRPHDLALQKPRSTIFQRNHLRLWLAPFRFENRSVWVGQVSRDIAIKGTLRTATLTTHVIDPNIDEAREHLLQSLLVAGVVERFGFALAMPAAPPSAPRVNLTNDPYFTDGLRLVALLSGRATIAPEDVVFLDWLESPDPITEAQRQAEAASAAEAPGRTGAGSPP